MGRVEEYQRDDGSWSTDPADATRVSPYDVVQSVLAISPIIPARVVVGMVGHESSFASNERDTEESGFQSYGLGQVSREEAVRAGRPAANPLDKDEKLAVAVSPL